MPGRPLRQVRARLNWGLANRCIGPEEVFSLCRLIDRHQARRNPEDGLILQVFLGRYRGWIKSQAARKTSLPDDQRDWVSNIQFQLSEDYPGTHTDVPDTATTDPSLRGHTPRSVAEWKASVLRLLGPVGKGGLGGKRFGTAPTPIKKSEDEAEAKGLRGEPGFWPDRRYREQAPSSYLSEEGKIVEVSGDRTYASVQAATSEASQRTAGHLDDLEYAALDTDKRFAVIWDFLLRRASPRTQAVVVLRLAAVIEALVKQSDDAVEKLTNRADRLEYEAHRVHSFHAKAARQEAAQDVSDKAAELTRQADDLKRILADSEGRLKAKDPTIEIGLEGYDPYDVQRVLAPYGVNAAVMRGAMHQLQIFLSERGFFSAAEPLSNPRGRSRRARYSRRVRSSRRRR